MIAADSRNKVQIKELVSSGYDQSYISINFNEVHDFDTVIQLYYEMVSHLIEQKYIIVYEKWFGKLIYKELLMSKRDIYFNRQSLILPPISYIEGTPAYGSIISSTTIYAVRGNNIDLDVNYLSNNEGRTIGAYYMDRLYLIEMISANYDEVFNDIEKLVQNSGFNCNNIVRTWIYMKQINDEYLMLNDSRKRFFQRVDIGISDKHKYLPASTCIGGKGSDNSLVTIDLLCVKESYVERIFTSNLNEAEGETYQFKPTFSRAMLIENEYYQEIQLSGTASVNEKGDSVFIGDAYQQINKALDNIISIITQYDFTLDNFVQSTCFFKRREYYKIFMKIMSERNINCFTVTFVEEDVCRENLLFELDGVLLKKKEK